MAKLTKNLAPLFDSSISYEPGERFMYGDHMYEALEPLSGAFDSTKVSEVTLADIFKGVSSNDVKCLAPEYDVNTEYSVENLVLHDGVLYECVETTTGPFDETKWSRKYLSDVGGLNSKLTKSYAFTGSGTIPSSIITPYENNLIILYSYSLNSAGSLSLNKGTLLKTVTNSTASYAIYQVNGKGTACTVSKTTDGTAGYIILNSNVSTIVSETATLQPKIAVIVCTRDAGASAYLDRRFSKPIVEIIAPTTYETATTHYNRRCCCMVVEVLSENTTITPIGNWENNKYISLV